MNATPMNATSVNTNSPAAPVHADPGSAAAVQHPTLSEREREAEAFRAEIRAFVRDHIPPVLREKSRLGVAITAAEENAWLKVLGERGWMVPHWPQTWGGTGWPAWKRAIFSDELVLGHAPEVNGITFEMVGPLIARFGTEEQKQRFLDRIDNPAKHWKFRPEDVTEFPLLQELGVELRLLGHIPGVSTTAAIHRMRSRETGILGG